MRLRFTPIGGAWCAGGAGVGAAFATTGAAAAMIPDFATTGTLSTAMVLDFARTGAACDAAGGASMMVDFAAMEPACDAAGGAAFGVGFGIALAGPMCNEFPNMKMTRLGSSFGRFTPA